jgi:hypothetical protein
MGQIRKIRPVEFPDMMSRFAGNSLREDQQGADLLLRAPKGLSPDYPEGG